MTPEQWIAGGLAADWLVDYRSEMPQHPTRRFAQRASVREEALGLCTHHSGSDNQDPVATAAYHISADNHVQEGGCPGLLYTFAISREIHPGQILLCNDLRSICWSQGKGTAGRPEWSGDENRHLLSCLVMGDFDESYRAGKSGNPTLQQLEAWLRLTYELSLWLGWDGRSLFGHYHFGKRDCPGRDLRQRIDNVREAAGPGLESDLAWQEALLRWDPDCLPAYGADGDWGTESRKALVRFERAHRHKVDGTQDPFTELLLLRKYPVPTCS